MGAALGQVHTGTREYAPRPARSVEIDVERRQLLFADPGEAEIPPIGGQPARFQHSLEDLHRRFPCQVVVAGARVQELDRD
ncbi:hypothetical protein D3C83_14530 [compost metagenome]